jgi:hypothetical protein
MLSLEDMPGRPVPPVEALGVHFSVSLAFNTTNSSNSGTFLGKICLFFPYAKDYQSC